LTRVRTSEAARADIRAIYRMGVEMFGVTQADAYANGMKRAILRLAEFPESAPVRAELTPSVRVLPYGAHVILYAVSNDSVHILRVRHAHEDWTSSPN
jgi:toxin ParE1/3/4